MQIVSGLGIALVLFGLGYVSGVSLLEAGLLAGLVGVMVLAVR